MKYVKILSLLLAFGAFQACATNNKDSEKGEKGQTVQKAATFENVQAKELKQVLEEKGDKITLLDVRTPGEIAAGKISKAAVEMDFYEEDFQSNVESLDKSKPVYVYCKAGGRSSSAANMLIEKGFKEVYNLNGGITAWERSGYGVE